MFTVYHFSPSGPVPAITSEGFAALQAAGWQLLYGTVVKTEDPTEARSAMIELPEAEAVKAWVEATGLDQDDPGCMCGCGMGPPHRFYEEVAEEEDALELYDTIEERDATWAADDAYEEAVLRKRFDATRPQSRMTSQLKLEHSSWVHERFAADVESGRFSDENAFKLLSLKDGSTEVWRLGNEELELYHQLERTIHLMEEKKQAT